MADLGFKEAFNISNIKLNEYLKMSLGTATPSQISALEAANLLADAPDYLYDDVFALCEQAGVFDSNGSAAAQQVADVWNANALNKPPSQVARELADKNIIDVEVISSNSGDTLSIVTKQNVSSGSPSGGVSSGTTVRTPMDVELDESGNVKFTPRAGKNKLGESVQGLLTMVSSAFTIVGASVVLGKLIEEGIYHTGKFFGADVTQFDRRTWSHLGSYDDVFGAPLLDAILAKIDPHEPNIVAYVSEDAFLASVDYLNSLDIFREEFSTTIPDSLGLSTQYFSPDIISFPTLPTQATVIEKSSQWPDRVFTDTVDIDTELFTGKVAVSLYRGTDGETVTYNIIYATKNIAELTDSSAKIFHTVGEGIDVYNRRKISTTQTPYKSYEHNGLTCYYVVEPIRENSDTYTLNYPTHTELQDNTSMSVPGTDTIPYNDFGRLAWALIFGITTSTSPSEYVKNQTDANVLSFPFDATQSERYSIVRNKYANLWDKSINRSILMKDGSILSKTYVPISIPNSDTLTSAKVLPGQANNNQTKVGTASSTKTTLSTISGTIAKKPSFPDAQPGDSGNTPEPVIPIVPPSSLWAVYNPTQAEVDAFGSWLWSSNPIEQIRKIFNDPAQGIIGIHKVFALPSVAGRRNIKVGYLDSGVNSNYIGTQYSAVNCGTVSVNEHFGNVFDYMPYTRVQCYLPFIGVVELDANDIMRGTVNITYGVDVLTGDCLAKISVERDDAGGILYSFPGNCAVRYPFSTGSYMSIVGYAAGALATVATANIGMFGAVGQIFGNRPTIQHGGAFAGNPGATGPKKPYLIITRPQQALARKFNEFEGYPVNTTQVLSDCKGFVRVKEVHLESINATDDELDMIDQILKEGVIVQF